MIHLLRHEFKPTDVAGIKIWYDSESSPINSNGARAEDGDFILTLRDLSGNYSDASASFGQGPFLRKNYINSQSSMKFDGINDYLTFPTLSLGSSFSVFIVQQVSSTAQLTSSSLTSSNCRITSTTLIVTEDNGFFNATSSSLSVGPSIFSLVEFIRNSGTVFFFQNSIPLSSDTIASNSIFDTIGSSTSPISGFISEIIIYSRNLSLQERNVIETYLNRKYNLFGVS